MYFLLYANALCYSAVLTDYNKGDSAKKELTRQVWNETRDRLLKIIQEFAKKVIRDENALRKYNMSRKCELKCLLKIAILLVYWMVRKLAFKLCLVDLRCGKRNVNHS